MNQRTIKYFISLLIIVLSVGLSGCNDPAPPTIGCRPIELINAIVQANADKDHDQIILPNNCIYELGNPIFEIPDPDTSADYEYAGLPPITSPITIIGNGSSIIRPNAQGTDDFRLIFVASGGSLALVDLTLENGLVSGYGGAVLVDEGTITLNQCILSNNLSTYAPGGAIASFNGHVVLTNSVIRNNSAGSGGGIYASESSVEIDFESLLEDNQSHGGGGAISMSGGDLTIYNSMIRNNSALSNGGAISAHYSRVTLHGDLLEGNISNTGGGGIFSIGSRNYISNSIIRQNQALDGGGMMLDFSPTEISQDTHIIENIADAIGGGIGLNRSANLSLENSTIANNQAGTNGGGIGQYETQGNSMINISNCTLSGNSAFYLGGGIHVNSDGWSIQNTTISGNNSSEGGGLFNNGILEMVNSTISGNQAEEGGGVMQSGYDEAYFSFVTVAENTAISGGGLEVDVARIKITNSIVAGNSPQNCLGDIVPINRNLDDDSSCGFSLTGDPLLEPLNDNGGPTYTHAIASFGPAAEVAVPCTATSLNLSTPVDYDQRGVARPQGVACDLGAFEAEISAMMSPPLPGCVYTASKNSNCRESDFNQAPVLEILMEGETAALVALNPENTYGKFSLQSGEQCWMALHLMTPPDGSGDCPVSMENPLQVPVEKEPETKTCKPTMGEAACKRAGGTWIEGITEADHCSCP
jgi:predicted outer membrane repeat protein